MTRGTGTKYANGLLKNSPRKLVNKIVSVYNEEDNTKNMRPITLKGDHKNNKMERLNGEIRDREKTMKGLKRKRTPILQGYQIYHNFIREHEALSGKTPAEACGIAIEGKNKWITLIQNAKQNKKV